MLLFLYALAVALPLGLAAAGPIAPAGFWSEAATATGLVALVALALQLVTSGRFEILAGRLGIDAIMAFHKQAAMCIVAIVILHPLLFVLPTALSSPERGLDRLIAMFTSPRLASGLVAWIAAIVLVVLALARRRLPGGYEVWRASHGVLAIVIVSTGLHHAVTAGTYSSERSLVVFWALVGLTAAGVVLVLYGVRWWRLRAHPWRVDAVRRVGDGLWQLDIGSPRPAPFRFNAGQFVWLTAAPRLFPLFDHPFSIASGPQRTGLSFIVREAGDFTNTIGRLTPGTRIGIDGPHGTFTLSGREGDAVLLIAGGVGIAPVLGILRDLVDRRDPRPVRLLYGAHAPDAIIARDEIEAGRGMIDLEAVFMSETDADGWSGGVGLIDSASLDHALSGLDATCTLAMVCGPDGMVSVVADHLLAKGLPIDSIVYERFDYAIENPTRCDRRRSRGIVLLTVVTLLAMAAFALR